MQRKIEYKSETSPPSQKPLVKKSARFYTINKQLKFSINEVIGKKGDDCCVAELCNGQFFRNADIVVRKSAMTFVATVYIYTE